MSKKYRATAQRWEPWFSTRTAQPPAAVRASVTGSAVVEGNTGSKPLTFTVTLSPAADVVTTIGYATSDGTAVAGRDYTAVTGSLAIDPGVTTATITVSIFGNTLVEPDKDFTLSITSATADCSVGGTATGAILNDDTPATLTAGVTGASVPEGNSATTMNALPFAISLNQTSTTGTTVSYATSDGTAVAGTDYVAKSGSVTIPAGATSATVTVNIIGNLSYTGDRNFQLRITSTQASVTRATAIGTILDDDAPPTAGTIFGINMPIANYALPPNGGEVTTQTFPNGRPADRLAQYGPIPASHTSNPGNLPGSWGTRENTCTSVGRKRVQVAFNRNPGQILDGSFDATITSYAKSIPAGGLVWLTPDHEPANQIAQGLWDPVQYHDMMVYVSALLKNLPAPFNDGRIRLMMNFSSDKYGPLGAHFDPAWCPTPAQVNNPMTTLSWDCYPFPTGGATYSGLTAQYRSPVENWQQLFDVTAQMGWNLPYRWGITEFNMPAAIWDRTIDSGGTLPNNVGGVRNPNDRAGRIAAYKAHLNFLFSMKTASGAACPPHHIFLWEGLDGTWHDFTDTSGRFVPAGMNLDTDAERAVFKNLFASSA